MEPIKLIIIEDEKGKAQLDFALEIAEKLFDIIQKYGETKESRDLEEIKNIPELESDYIVVVHNFENKIQHILAQFIPSDKILNLQKFMEMFLTENEKMQCLKHKLEVSYPVYRSLYQDERISIGDFTYGTPELYANDRKTHATIGKFCSIAESVKICLSVEHRTDWNTTYPFNIWLPQFSWIEGHPSSKGDVKIGNDVWIGMGATILSGVEIGDGAVIGTNAVVSHSVPPYSIAAGNPAKVIRRRFDEETIERLEKMQWWEWDYKHIYRAIPFLQSNNFEALYKYWLENIKKREME